MKAVNSSSYKWMLFGNASTLFFPDAALQLLQDFDAELPYIITDGLLWNNASGASAHDEAPRCLPCHLEGKDEMARLSQGTI